MNLQTITDLVVENEGLSILEDLVTTAELADALSNPDETYTVFAPNDEAFTALLASVEEPVATWLETPELIANVLLHHVVGTVEDSDAVVAAESLTTLAGTSIPVEQDGEALTVGGAPLSDTLDIEASNGIVHVLDGVMVPPTILELASGTEDVSALVEAVTTLNNEEINGLLASGPITVFAPVNEAFAALGDNGPTGEDLANILRYHAVDGQFLTTEATETIETVQGDSLTVNVDDEGNVTVVDGTDTPANVLGRVLGFNGVVYLVDKVLLPPTAP